MDELITFETIRNIHRGEKTDQLQRLPPNFFTTVGKWIDYKRALGTDTSLLEINSVKKIMSDIINRRQRKILISALHTVRGDVPPDTLTGDEREFFDKIVNSLKSQKRELTERMLPSDIIAEDKIQDLKRSMEEIKPQIQEPKEIPIITPKVEEPKKEPPKEMTIVAPVTEKPTMEMDVMTGAIVEKKPEVEEPKMEEKIIEGPLEQPNVIVLSDLPKFVGPDLKPYGPFKAQDKALLPECIVKVLEMRNVGQRITV